MSVGSRFQTDGAAERKATIAQAMLLAESSVRDFRMCLRALMWCQQALISKQRVC